MSLNFKVVLVEPLYQGNVGSVARVMKNFGFSELVLVNPCPLEGEARAMSSHARDVLEGAIIVSNIEDAVAGASLLIGTTGITGSKFDEHIRIPAHVPREMKELLEGYSGTIALLFGRENRGFTKDELCMMDMILTIPTSEAYPVMNLSHAVAVILYELSDVEAGKTPLADLFDTKLLMEHLSQVLEDIDYPAHKKEKTELMLKRIFGRARLIPREVQTLRGILRRIQRYLVSGKEK
ncbi:RNA methyltransferase [Methanomethylovorans sp.]|uniref:RNA methyltransferase n=1 Tax=Methanomethylovorans sp. TaxID=2758717 RepID=UPI00345ECB38